MSNSITPTNSSQLLFEGVNPNQLPLSTPQKVGGVALPSIENFSLFNANKLGEHSGDVDAFQLDISELKVSDNKIGVHSDAGAAFRSTISALLMK